MITMGQLCKDTGGRSIPEVSGNAHVLRRKIAQTVPATEIRPVRLQLRESKGEVGGAGWETGTGRLINSWVPAGLDDEQCGLCSKSSGAPLEGTGQG